MSYRSATILVLLATSTAGASRSQPRYLIERVEVIGNRKTKATVIKRALWIRPGTVLAANDPRVALSRYRLLSTGFFADVRLALRRGSARGRAVLVVEVNERGTILLSDIFLGTSEATTAWAGLGLAEKNLLGYGIGIEGAFVLGADPSVERGTLQQAYWLQLDAPRWTARRWQLSASILFLDGNEFFRTQGRDQSSDPDDFLSIRYRRIGGTLGSGFDIARHLRLHLGYRLEAVEADVPAAAVRRRPDGSFNSIDFDVIRGNSRLSNLQARLELDTRSDPVTPNRGFLFEFSAELSSGIVGSSYDYLKLSTTYEHYIPLRWGHVLSPSVSGGVVVGEAPFFEKFFVGDFSDLLPSRALGLNFSTQPSRDIFGTSIDSKRYEEIAARVAVEYIVPWFRGGRWFYSGDFFGNVGLFLLTSREQLGHRDGSLSEALPIDLTLNLGLRLDTVIGVFNLSLGNALGRVPF